MVRSIRSAAEKVHIQLLSFSLFLPQKLFSLRFRTDRTYLNIVTSIYFSLEMTKERIVTFSIKTNETGRNQPVISLQYQQQQKHRRDNHQAYEATRQQISFPRPPQASYP